MAALTLTPCSCVSCMAPAMINTSPCPRGTAAMGLRAPRRYTSNNRGEQVVDVVVLVVDVVLLVVDDDATPSERKL